MYGYFSIVLCYNEDKKLQGTHMQRVAQRLFTNIQGQNVRYGQSSKVASNKWGSAYHQSKCQPPLKIATLSCRYL